MSNTLQLLERNAQYKYPYFFLAFYITFLLATVCLANRITLIGPYLEPGGIFVFVFTFWICDIVGEVYGYAYPRLFIWVGAACQFTFALVVTLVSHLPVPTYFNSDYIHAYNIVYDPTLRYVASGLAALLIGEFANVYLLAKWKIKFRGRFFVIRSLVSTAIGQGLLTVIVDILNYTGKIAFDQILSMMLSGFLFKIICAAILVFPAWLLVRWLKSAENIDHFDVNTNFNPFTLRLKDNVIPLKRSDMVFSSD